MFIFMMLYVCVDVDDVFFDVGWIGSFECV